MSAVPPSTFLLGIPGLLAEALSGVGDLIRGEIALLCHEMAANLRCMVIGLAAMAGAAVFSVVGFLILVDTLVKWLTIVVGSEALSALIDGIAFLVIGIVLALAAKRRFSLDGLMPTRTSRQLRQDAAVIKEHVDA
ncbi:phage holin family protein [Methylobacterium sp. J-059]|uniref:phage holin family protein n=1 Tax=Methylobacterium sp. J-059 TaxID=2836643 RepID=UPI001FB8F11A|nr:phage holin family protein [Methylobacterium sp. J-059]MCJ2040401.1 phage holin family protein [Methylobacterium sp. J-059]